MKRFWIAASLPLLLLGLAADARAQAGAARGAVIDEKGEPVAGAHVQIEYKEGVPGNFESTTNDKGQFIQVGLRPGTYRFTVNKEGYRGAWIEHRINLGQPTRLPEIQILSMAAAQAAAGAAGDDAAAAEREALTKLFNGAIELAEAGELDKAKAAFEEALALRADFPEAWYNIGYVHIRREQFAEAEAALKQALELRPGYSDARMALSSVYQQTGRSAEATALITEAAAAGGGDAKVFFNLGVMKLNENDSEAAAEAFLKVEELDPSNPEAQYYLATIALNQGRTDESIARLEKYLGMSPKNEQNVATAQGLLQALKK